MNCMWGIPRFSCEGQLFWKQALLWIATELHPMPVLVVLRQKMFATITIVQRGILRHCLTSVAFTYKQTDTCKHRSFWTHGCVARPRFVLCPLLLDQARLAKQWIASGINIHVPWMLEALLWNKQHFLEGETLLAESHPKELTCKDIYTKLKPVQWLVRMPQYSSGPIHHSNLNIGQYRSRWVISVNHHLPVTVDNDSGLLNVQRWCDKELKELKTF